jgi:hypothetical protein
VTRRALAAALVLASVCAARAEDGDASAKKKAVLVGTVATGFPVSAQRVLDVDKDGKSELLVVGVNGEVRAWRQDAEKGGIAERPTGSLVLRFPDRTLLAVADLFGDGRPPQLVEMTKDGVSVHQAEKDGSYARGGDLVAPKAKLALRVGRPTFADVARDVNGDGRADLVVPRGDECDLWLNGGIDAKTGLPTFTKAATIPVDMKSETSMKADALSDVLESSFRVPNLSISDVNGDGRPDLLVEDGHMRTWRLQREDGTFPAAPDVTLDLSTFRDTTPAAEVQLGRTVAGGDEQRMETRDLDGDGIPDYVIAHRRKVWVFHGTKNGPQFTQPSDVLRVADDVTVLLTVRIDGDKYPDLLLLRVQMPTIATLLRGLVADWDIEIAALGYANLGGKKFDSSPKWKGDLSLRMPSIIGILRRPEELVRQLEGTAKKFRRVVVGDFDGDGKRDVAVADEKDERIEFFTDAAKAGDDGEQEFADVFFGSEKRTWELAEILRWAGDLAARQTARHTGGRPAYAAWALRSESDFTRTGAYAGDFDGSGRATLVIAYDKGGVEGVFDFVRVEK